MTSFSFGRIDFSMWGISSKILLTCTPSMIERSSTVSGSFLRISIISCLLVISRFKNKSCSFEIDVCCSYSVRNRVFKKKLGFKNVKSSRSSRFASTLPFFIWYPVTPTSTSARRWPPCHPLSGRGRFVYRTSVLS